MLKSLLQRKIEPLKSAPTDATTEGRSGGKKKRRFLVNGGAWDAVTEKSTLPVGGGRKGG